MTNPRILVLGTGGTIAGAGASATGAAYRPGGLALETLGPPLERLLTLLGGLPGRLAAGVMPRKWLILFPVRSSQMIRWPQGATVRLSA